MRSRLGLLLMLVVGVGGRPASAIVGRSTEGGPLAASVLMVLNRAGPVAGFCSAIVVAQDAVLTAAHCVPPGASIKLHRADGGAPTLLDVAAVERHPGYRADAIARRERSVDLALVRLAAPLPSLFHPVVLGQGADVAVGQPFRLAGFGVQREGEPTSSGTLRVMTAVAVSPVSTLLLWARDPHAAGGGACTGDSGGPVLPAADDRVVGVIAWSAGTGDARCGALTQAVWIGPQRGWIDTVLARWARSSPPSR